MKIRIAVYAQLLLALILNGSVRSILYLSVLPTRDCASPPQPVNEINAAAIHFLLVKPSSLTNEVLKKRCSNKSLK